MSTAAKLFHLPLRHEHGYVWDAAGEMVASYIGPKREVLEARGWGRIKYLPGADALWQAWNAEFERVAGGLTDGDEVVCRLTAFIAGEAPAAAGGRKNE